MARKGIHPLMRTMTMVLRNGSSYQLSTVLKRATPWKLQTVGRCGESAKYPSDLGSYGRGRLLRRTPTHPAVGRQPARRPTQLLRCHRPGVPLPFP